MWHYEGPRDLFTALLPEAEFGICKNQPRRVSHGAAPSYFLCHLPCKYSSFIKISLLTSISSLSLPGPWEVSVLFGNSIPVCFQLVSPMLPRVTPTSRTWEHTHAHYSKKSTMFHFRTISLDSILLRRVRPYHGGWVEVSGLWLKDLSDPVPSRPAPEYISLGRSPTARRWFDT